MDLKLQKDQADPKLQEAYDRVMNAKPKITEPQQPEVMQTVELPTVEQSQQQLPQTPTPTSTLPQAPQPMSQTEKDIMTSPISNQTPSTNTQQNNLNQQTEKPKKSHKLLFIIIILGVIIFFIAYALIWTKAFGLL